VDLRFTAEDEAFRADVQAWFATYLTEEFTDLTDLGGSGRERAGFEVCQAWERLLG